ncbi:acyl-CoA dehydrogenase family protein [Herbaspirillum sp. GCM10030257]|uniref:acyl-CoA dehydrogenase family protein n=1 Tax=Herbaspirillum sp. GCM10030257 TaxID=3273393 RepID=UPI0036200024
MDFTFDEDQILLVDSVRKFLMNEVSPELIRELWTRPTGRSRELWNLLAAQGLTGLSVPEASGGMGMNDTDWVLIAQECGYYALPEPLLDTAWAGAGLIAALPDSEFRSQWLAKIADGSARIALAQAQSGLVPDAHLASVILMPHDGVLYAVSPQLAQLTMQPSIDLSRRLYSVDWNPRDAERVATNADGIWTQACNRGALAAAAQLLGLTQRMLDLSIDYTAQRKQFGKPIGSYQAVKHHLADVAIKLEFARPVVHRAAYALAHGQQHAGFHVSHAKVAAAEAALLAARNGIQVHGAMGYTWEMDLQIFMKMAWALDGAYGDRSFHLARVRQFVLQDDAALGPGHTFKD